MRRLVSIAAIAAASVLVPRLALAEDSAEDFTSQALRAGSWSMQFEILDNFRLGSFEGAAVSATHRRSERSAWRYGISFGGSSLDNEVGRDSFTDTTSTHVGDASGDLNQQSVGIDLTIVRYPSAAGRIRPFWGVGPSASFFHGKNENVSVSQSGDRFRDSSRRTAWTFGARALLGVEVFAARKISLIGQYATSLTYQHARDRSRNEFLSGGGTPGLLQGQEYVQSTTGWRLGQESVRFGVSAYF